MLILVCVAIEKELESHQSEASGYHEAKKAGSNKRFLWRYLNIFQPHVLFVIFTDVLNTRHPDA